MGTVIPRTLPASDPDGEGTRETQVQILRVDQLVSKGNVAPQRDAEYAFGIRIPGLGFRDCPGDQQETCAARYLHNLVQDAIGLEKGFVKVP